jgi:glucan 1,3-beta-glucosidase
MHFSSSTVSLALGLAAMAIPMAAAADGRLGYALGAKRVNGECKTTADYEADFDALKSQSTIVRGYAADECNFAQQILPAAKSKGFQVVLGIWADTPTGYDGGKAAVQAYSAQYAAQIYAVTVGSETLYRGNFTGDQLAAKIQDVKRAVPNLKVGTADSWNKYADGTADPVIRVADILYSNAFAYWQGQDINNASATFIDDIQQSLARVQSVRGSLDGVEFAVGETGWPTGGDKYGSSVPSVENAEKFWKTGICAIRKWGLSVFAFEAFDEPQKPPSIGDNGEPKDETHWGVYKADRTLKYDNAC